MAEESPVGSPLSSLSSEAFEGEEEENERLEIEALMRPAKRQKLGVSSARATPAPVPEDDALSISTDTSGDLPGSPNPQHQRGDDDDHEQVTICAWLGCTAGDLRDMDKLVRHIHDEHIETRSKKYTCEWSDCIRRSMPHASGYALKSHMRSHTKEKPFYCALPGRAPYHHLNHLLICIPVECDKAFTRSDALAKHMRTVHETEALRPSDPIPKSMNGSKSRLKLVIKPSQNATEGVPPLNGFTNGKDSAKWVSSYNPDLGFTAEEEARGPEGLFQLLRRQVHWAEEEGELLKRQCDAMEQLRKKEWVEKEVLLAQVIHSETTYHQRREEALKEMANLPSVEEIKAAAARSVVSENVAADTGPEPSGDPGTAAPVPSSMPNLPNPNSSRGLPPVY